MFWGVMSVIFGAAGATLLFTGADLWGRDEFPLLAIEFIVMGSVILAQVLHSQSRQGNGKGMGLRPHSLQARLLYKERGRRSQD